MNVLCLGDIVSSASYTRPTTLDEALAAIADGGAALAGGTDFYPARVGKPIAGAIVDLTGIEALRGIRDVGDHWRIGGTTTWSDIVNAELPPLFDGLKRAAREVGGVQIQNAGTIAGNLCNASPAADGVPALLTLDARIELAAADGPPRLLPLGDFILGNRRTARRPQDLLTAILVPKPAGHAVGHFLKLGARKYLVISIAMVGAAIATDESRRVTHARVAIGACAPTARRLPELEAALLGRTADAMLGATASASHLSPLAPIDDVRASASYRLDAALTLVRRTLDQLGARFS